MSVAATVLQDARAFIIENNVRKFEQKRDFSNIINAYIADREYTIPGLASIRRASTQTTDALYIAKEVFADQGDKSCTPSGVAPSSAKVTVGWDKIVLTLALSEKVYDGNEISYQRAIADGIVQLEESMYDILEARLLTHLDANISTVNNGGSGTFAGNTMTIANADINRFYNLSRADMNLNNYPVGDVFHVHDTMWGADRSFYLNQGSQNSTNTNFQFDGFNAFASNKITPGVGEESLGYLIPSMGVGILDWNTPVNVRGRVHGNDEWTTFQSLIRPDFTLDVFLQRGCTDSTAAGGDVQDPTDLWEFTLNFAPVVQPTFAGDPGAIFRYAVST